jgi:hypothetical protein
MPEKVSEAVKVVNFLLNSRIFDVLCEEMGSTFEQLLLHSQGHWLSYRKCSLT